MQWPKKWQALFALILSVITSYSFGLKSDRDQSATFTADHVAYNQKTRVTQFTGNVQMIQGTTRLVADEVSIESDHNGKITKITAKGTNDHPAHYSELPDHQEKNIDAYAETIEYYPIQSLAVLITQAELKQGMNSFKGPRIVYNIAKQIILSTPTQQDVQSTIVIQPQDLPGNHPAHTIHGLS